MARAASASTGNCFVAGTAVLTGEGTKNIEDIEVGDLVYAYDEETGETGLREVVRLFRNTTLTTTTLTVLHENGTRTSITSTPGHKYYVPGNDEARDPFAQQEHASYAGLGLQWVSARDLRAGDILVNVNGQRVIVEWITHELLESPVAIYNFEVRDYHTYYVGDSGVLAHNLDCSGIKTGDTKNYSVHESQNAAFRAAKRDAGIPMNQQPSSVGPAISKQGNVIPGKTYSFGNNTDILLHSAGHPSLTMTGHFNYGGWHYFF